MKIQKALSPPQPDNESHLSSEDVDNHGDVEAISPADNTRPNTEEGGEDNEASESDRGTASQTDSSSSTMLYASYIRYQLH